MKTIEVIHVEAPTIEPSILAALKDLGRPRDFLRWNPRFAPEPANQDHWQGRWEIWCELMDVAHPLAKNKLAETDEWDSEHQCWVRFLQTYQTADEKFAPADERLIVGLEMANTWKNRRFYEDHVEEPEAREDRMKMLMGQEQIKEGSRYFRKFDSTSVGAYVNSGWRWRTR